MTSVTLDLELDGTAESNIQDIIDDLATVSSYQGDDVSSAASDSTFMSAARALLGDVGGVRLTAYDDTNGLRTIGVGYNMDQYGEVITGGTPTDFQTNNPSLSSVLANAGISLANQEDVYLGNLSISQSQSDALTDLAITSRLADMELVFQGAPDLSGTYLSPNELLTSLSLYYNLPDLLGQNLRTAFLNNDANGALTEVLEESNALYSAGDPKAAVAGVANRRLKEGAILAGDTSVMPSDHEYMDILEAVHKRWSNGDDPNSSSGAVDPSTDTLSINVPDFDSTFASEHPGLLAYLNYLNSLENVEVNSPFDWDLYDEPPVQGVKPQSGDEDANGDGGDSDDDDDIQDGLSHLDAGGGDDDGSSTGGYADDVKSNFDDGSNSSSPLVLDLDGDGVELVSLQSAGAVYWDIDVDGFAEASGWVGSDDGLLAIDLNNDGIINDSAELFGNQTGYENGFLALSAYDSNDDGVIDLSDSAWDNLIVWRDANSNGYSEDTELHSMSDLLITSIDLGYSNVATTIAGNDVLQESTFTINGNVNDVVDAYFKYSDLNSVYDQSFELNPDTIGLSNLRGYGIISVMQVAMSLDNTGTGNLLDLVSDLNDTSFANLFDETNDIRTDIRDIMFRWAGVDGVPPTSRGVNVDAQELEFLEKMMGQDFVQVHAGGATNPGPYAATLIDEAFEIAYNNIYARLVTQVAGGQLFDGDFHYDVASDSFSGITGIDSTALSSLETEATALSTTGEKTIFWGNVIRMVEFAIGTSNLSTGDQTALDDAITNSDASLDLSTIVGNLDFVAPAGSTYNGTSGDDTLTGGTGYDTLNGDTGNDTLYGNDGNDTLNGNGGDDALYGGNGSDYLLGGGGNDTYHYDLSTGWDIIKESGIGTGNDADEIVFGSGIDSGDLTLTRYNSNGLVIDIDTGTQTGQIFIEDQFKGNGHVETIRFSDNSTIDLDSQDWTTYGTTGNDTIYGVHIGSGGTGIDTIYGGAGNDYINGAAINTNDSTADTLYGEAGNDTIYGEYGDDVLYGGDGDDYLHGGGDDDVLYDGAGDDTLIGGGGVDDFHYQSGHTTVSGNASSTIYLDAAYDGVTPDYYRIGNDLQIYFTAANTLTVVNMFNGSQITALVYDNTTTVDLSAVTYVQQGTSGNDTLSGTGGDDLLYGYEGNDTLGSSSGNNYGDDTLYGGAGNDTLHGGQDNDYLDGGAGDDIMNGSYGNDHYVYVSGHDTINEYSTGTDVLEIDNSWTVDDLSFARYSTATNDLVITVGTTGVNSITIDNMFYGNRQIETVSLDDGNTTIDLTSMDYVTYGTSGNDTFGGITNSNISGGTVSDTLYGLAGNDTLSGQGGADTLIGGDGNDVLKGQGGDDLYIYDGGLDELRDGNYTSNDTLWITGGVVVDEISIANTGTYNATITVNSGTDEVFLYHQRYTTTSYDHIENLRFDDGFETDQLESYNGWMWGTTGNDSTSGNSSDNVIIGDAGNDTIDAGAGADDVHGGAGTDTIHGDDGNDFLHGGVGDDTIYGDDGLDVLWGGSGSDTFSFDATTAYNNTDQIADFSASEGDVIDISDLLSAYDPMTDVLTDFVQITDNGTDSTLSVDANGGGDSFSAVATILGVTGITDEAALVTSGNLAVA